MGKEKNVFLTTFGQTKDRLDIDYYMCENTGGTVSYTTGISMAEAGIKYMLSQYHIDEIILIGPPVNGADESIQVAALKDVELNDVANLDDMNEFDFLNYRIAEFMNQLDFEMLDISDSVSPDRLKELKKRISAFVAEQKNFGFRELFYNICSDREFESEFKDSVLAGCNRAESEWVEYYIYSQMDSFYKMHMRQDNTDTIVKFLPNINEGELTLDYINTIVSKTLEENRDASINLFLDTQGLSSMDGNTLISTFLLTNKKIGYGCSVKGLINTHRNSARIFGEVSNVIKSYEIQTLLSGIDIFLKYGKVDMLKDYWNFFGIENEITNGLFYGMDCIDEGITLCNVDLIASGINVIRQSIQRYDGSQGNIYIDIMINAIKADYGALLKGDSLSIAELLKWSYRKGLYQQTLTIIESKVPVDMVTRGIYYYARSTKELPNIMKEFNYLYWLESSKMRWAFNDIEHYFIKSYGRSVLDYRQKPDNVARDYAKLRIDALHGRAEGVLPAYSDLNNDDLLYELLLQYYRIGNLRNQVNHAIVDDMDLDILKLGKRKDNRELLNGELEKFIGLYATVCKKTKKKHEPVLLYSNKMKAYARHHEIKPMETTPDISVGNNYVCSFNGKEVHIDISMWKVEEDFDVEDD